MIEMTAGADGRRSDSPAQGWASYFGCLWVQVQKDIREGHAVTVDKVLQWISEDGNVKGVSVCDAGAQHCLTML